MALNIFKVSWNISRTLIAIWVIFFIGVFIKNLVDGSHINSSNLITFTITLFGGSLFILAFTRATGHIVRGFMGIPKGQSYKTTANIFEGSRRIVKVIAGIWTIGWLFTFFSYIYWVYKYKCSVITSTQALAGDSTLFCGENNLEIIFYVLSTTNSGLYITLIGFLLFIWVFTWAMGHIVRFFMGIPKDQDHKNKPNNSVMNEIISMTGPTENIVLPAQD